jgi:hypothetical protein
VFTSTIAPAPRQGAGPPRYPAARRLEAPRKGNRGRKVARAHAHADQGGEYLDAFWMTLPRELQDAERFLAPSRGVHRHGVHTGVTGVVRRQLRCFYRAEHRRRFGRDETAYDPWHYVPVLLLAMAMARCVLPVPVPPTRTILRCWATKARGNRARIGGPFWMKNCGPYSMQFDIFNGLLGPGNQHYSQQGVSENLTARRAVRDLVKDFVQS